jgi:hypothetical protein
VDEVNRSNVRRDEPSSKPRIVQTGVPDVEIQAPAATAPSSGTITDDSGDEGASEVDSRLREKSEQRGGGSPVENAPQSALLHHRLRVRAVVAEICQADAVNPGWVASCPATPHQTRNIEQ